MFEIAKDEFQKNHIAAASELLYVYLNKNPENILAWLMYGDTLHQLGRLKEAEEVMLKYINLADDKLRKKAEEILARLYSDCGKLEDAEKYFNEVLKSENYSHIGWILILKGSNLLIMNDFEKAEECFKKALTLKEVDLDEAYLNLGYVLRVQQRYKEAQIAFEQALRNDPDCNDAQSALNSIKNIDLFLSETSKILFSLENEEQRNLYLNKLYKLAKEEKVKGHYGVAFELLNRYLHYKPYHDYAWFLYGDSLRLLGKFKDSYQALLQALKLTDIRYKNDVKERLAILCMDYGHYLEASKWCNEIMADKNFNPAGSFWISIGSNCLNLTDFNKAEEYFRNALKLKKVNAEEAYFKLGIALRAQRKYKEAKEAFEQALQILPDYPEAKEALISIENIDNVLELINRFQKSALT